jgi:hypothetical protein
MAEDEQVRRRLASGLVDRFASVDAASYDDIRSMLAACEQAGFLELR